jgi:hypothetical protein
MHKFEELKLDSRDEHLQDISKYVHSHVDRLSVPPTVKITIMTNIERRSSGVFLWAVLVIKILREKRDNGASFSELVDSLATVPDKLENVFANILEDADKGTLAALEWILYAKRPARPKWLYLAIKTSTGQLSTGRCDEHDVDKEAIENFIVRSIRGLVEVSQRRNTASYGKVQFIHESVREYLLYGGLVKLMSCDQCMIAVRPCSACSMVPIIRSARRIKVRTDLGRQIG